jgi:hypothetical protein
MEEKTMDLANSQKPPDPVNGKTASRQFVVRGQSEIYPGTHYLGIFGGFMPYDGGHGRLSEERCRANIKRFASREEAQAYSDENNRLEKRVWKTFVEEEPK